MQNKDISEPKEEQKEKRIEEPKTQQIKTAGKIKKTPVFSKSSNQKLIKNAITNVCLAGEPNKSKREEVLQVLAKVTPEKNVIVLFKDTMGVRQVLDYNKCYVGF